MAFPYKPVRSFSANVGDFSTGTAGPDAIEADIDKITKMFDPSKIHDDGTPGGISAGNFATNFSIEEKSSIGGCSGLKILVTTNFVINLTANAVGLENDSGATKKIKNVSTSINTGGYGVGGLDTGTIAADTWYSVWIIYNPASDVVAGLLSASATAPTLPNGYTYYSRFGWVRTNGSGYLYRTIQYGNRVQYIVDGTILTAPRTIVSGTVGDINGAYVAATISPFVPTTSSRIFGLAFIMGAHDTARYMILAPNNNYGSWIGPNIAIRIVNPSGMTSSAIPFDFMLESSNLYWAGGPGYVTCLGWQDNL